MTGKAKKGERKKVLALAGQAERRRRRWRRLRGRWLRVRRRRRRCNQRRRKGEGGVDGRAWEAKAATMRAAEAQVLAAKEAEAKVERAG